MKPANFDRRTGALTVEQYLGLADGMTFRVAGRMLTLAGDYANDAIDLHEEALDPRLTASSMAGLARAATRVETRMARLLVLAAEHCRETELTEIPLAIRSTMKTVSRCRSAICGMAMAAAQPSHARRLAA